VAFEAKVDEVTAILENLSDTDWRKTTASEKWTVAATAHHVAQQLRAITYVGPRLLLGTGPAVKEIGRIPMP